MSSAVYRGDAAVLAEGGNERAGGGVDTEEVDTRGEEKPAVLAVGPVRNATALVKARRRIFEGIEFPKLLPGGSVYWRRALNVGLTP